MLDDETKAAARDAIERVLTGRERVPGDLPYPSSIGEYALASVWPNEDPQRSRWTTQGRALGRAARQVYIAGYFAGRAGDQQLGEQLRSALGYDQAAAAQHRHPYVGLAACLICDQAPDDAVHGGVITSA